MCNKFDVFTTPDTVECAALRPPTWGRIYCVFFEFESVNIFACVFSFLLILVMAPYIYLDDLAGAPNSLTRLSLVVSSKWRLQRIGTIGAEPVACLEAHDLEHLVPLSIFVGQLRCVRGL